MSVTRRTWMRGALAAVLVVGSLTVAFSCGGSSETTSTAAPATTAAPTTTMPTPPTAGAGSTTTVTFSGEEAAVAAAWTEFFDGTGTAQEKVALLEDGDKYATELETNAANPMALSSSAAVTAVIITSPNEADVTYTILLNGTPALADQKGTAVKQDDQWKVGAQSFLSLLALQGVAVPTTAAP